MRLHDLGRAGKGRLPGLWADHVQESGQGSPEALLHQPGVLQLPAGGQTGLSPLRRQEGGGHGARRSRGEARRQKDSSENHKGRLRQKDGGENHESRLEEEPHSEARRKKDHCGEENRRREKDRRQERRDAGGLRKLSGGGESGLEHGLHFHEGAGAQRQNVLLKERVAGLRQGGGKRAVGPGEFCGIGVPLKAVYVAVQAARAELVADGLH